MRHDLSLIAGVHVHGNSGLGVLGSDIPQNGKDGPSALYTGTDLDKEVRYFLSVPPVGLDYFMMEEDGSFVARGVSVQTFFAIDRYVSGVYSNTITHTVAFGSAISAAQISNEILVFDRERPNAGGLPIINIIGMPHSGTRSVAAYYASIGRHSRLMHVQFHYHTPDFLQKLIDDDLASPVTPPASGRCVLAIRDPLLILLSTKERADDTIERTFAALDALYAMRWPTTVMAIEVTPGLTNVGSFGNYPDKVAAQSGVVASFSQAGRDLLDRLRLKEPVYRPRLQALGYANLLWWS